LHHASEILSVVEDIAAYLLRPPLSLEKLVYLDAPRANNP
jgi:hypothetical protein